MDRVEAVWRRNMMTQSPFLDALCWQMESNDQLTPVEVLQTYERGWRFLGVLADPSEEEWQEIRQLSTQYGSWLQADLMLGQEQPMKYQWHESIMVVLNALRADSLTAWGVCFGGGTLVSLICDEHRLSQDIDLLASNVGYRELRWAVAEQSYDALFRPTDRLRFPRNMQMDQYGIRFPVVVNSSASSGTEVTIKLEIIAEGRIELEPPRYLPALPVPCLSLVDCWAEKLLANADRWPDDRIRSRDLIDLAVLRLRGEIPEAAIQKAAAAYPVLPGLRSALDRFQAQPDWRRRCYEALAIDRPDLVVDGIDRLSTDLDLPLTIRRWREAQENS
jgi:hypothetical protein